MFLYLQAKKGFFEVASLENLFVPFIFSFRRFVWTVILWSYGALSSPSPCLLACKQRGSIRVISWWDPMVQEWFMVYGCIQAALSLKLWIQNIFLQAIIGILPTFLGTSISNTERRSWSSLNLPRQRSSSKSWWLLLRSFPTKQHSPVWWRSKRVVQGAFAVSAFQSNPWYYDFRNCNCKNGKNTFLDFSSFLRSLC